MTAKQNQLPLCISLIFLAAAALAQPPVAPVRPVTDVFYGISVVDDYRYMENLQDPAVQAWIKGQADYADSVLKAIPGRLIAKLLNGYRDAGIHQVSFDASHLPSGIYIYRLTAGSLNASGKMVLMK